MDMPGNEPITEPPKETEESVNYHAPNISLVGSFCTPVWDPQINGPILSYCNANVQNEATSSGPSRAGANWAANTAYRQNLCVPTFPSSVVPPRLPNFLEDSSFIDRAARFSCFGGGNLSQMINPFSNLGHLNANTRSSLIQRPNEVLAGDGTEGSPFKNETKIENFRRSHDEVLNGVDLLGTETEKAEYSGREGQEEFPGKGVGLKKRKRAELKIVNDESNEAVQPANKIENNTSENRGNDDGKNLSLDGKGLDPPKEDYIHVRARRGQATNSHSLAERIRREKISERMKFLQDLVPGCSKVTGKAVMLDEIINYVQSLQRQVEFLSMKLAMVNPSMDFDIEGVLSKDILQTRAGLSSSLAFPPDMMAPFSSIRQPQNQVIHQTTLHRPIDFHSNVVSGGSREPTSHAPGVWDDNELHNIVQNGFNLTALQHASDLSGHAKAEP